jgi:DNA-directed RNA polymerase specialized sigma24 family protein
VGCSLDDAEDVTQDVFVKVFETIERFDGDAPRDAGPAAFAG